MAASAAAQLEVSGPAEHEQGTPGRTRAFLARAVPCLVALALVSPSLVWLARDRSVWPWDQAWYGAGSVDLFYALIHTPSLWLREMLAVVEAQSPGVVWLGQVFVPLGLLIGSVDDGLLVSILATQAAALLLTYRALMELSARHAIALAGCLVIASAPLFVGLSHQYFAEPLQLLAVAWFVLIMSAAPRWSGAFTLAQLAAAAAVALAAKVSSPAYCAGPGAVALWYALRKDSAWSPKSWREPRTLLAAALALLLMLAAAAWYRRNLGHVMYHVSASVAGPHAEIYGASEAFARAVAHRGFVMLTSFFRPFAAAALGAVVAAGALWRGPRPAAGGRFGTGAIVAAAQLAAVLCILALSPNREARYLLALLPYAALLAAWALWRIGRPLLTAAAALALVAQLAVSHAQALGLAPAYVYGSPWIVPPRAQVDEAKVLEGIVWRTCAGTAPRPQRYWNVVGIELPWLNKNSAAYAASKTLGPRGLVGCRYDSIFNFTVTDLDQLWGLVGKMELRYYVTRGSGLAAVPPDDAHLVAVNRNTLPFLERVRASGEFTVEPPLAEDPDVLILRRR